MSVELGLFLSWPSTMQHKKTQIKLVRKISWNYSLSHIRCLKKVLPLTWKNINWTNRSICKVDDSRVLYLKRMYAADKSRRYITRPSHKLNVGQTTCKTIDFFRENKENFNNKYIFHYKYSLLQTSKLKHYLSSSTTIVE